MSESFERLRKTLKALRVSNTRKVVLDTDYLDQLLNDYDTINSRIKDLEDKGDPLANGNVGGTLHGGGFK